MANKDLILLLYSDAASDLSERLSFLFNKPAREVPSPFMGRDESAVP
jgi:hypothetical protein